MNGQNKDAKFLNLLNLSYSNLIYTSRRLFILIDSINELIFTSQFAQEMITIVVGTNRKNSVSRQIAEYYQSILNDKGSESQIIDLVDLPYDFSETALYENNGMNSQFNKIREQVQSADKLVFVVPEYNGSFPGVLKAFLDGLKYPEGVRNKKAALIGISSGVQGGVFAMSHLTDIFNYLGMHVFALKPKLAAIEKNFSDGQVTNELYDQLLNEQAEKFIKF